MMIRTRPIENKNRVAQALVREAELMSQVTGLEFRLCLELLLNTKNKP